MSIRSAQRSDVPDIRDVLYRSFYQTFRTEKNHDSLTSYLDSLNEHAIEAMMDEVDTRFLVMEEEGKIVGMSQIVNESFGMDSGDCMKIERLYIDPDRLGKGSGKIMMEHIIQLAKDEEHQWLWLLVLRSNFRGVRFYERFGFKAFDTSPGKFVEDKEIDLWMRMPLT
ncbi:MAG: GNAT family N-acetyltransferase [Flavobacteriales bacterium]|nr:GNAT family N-acetyltransferase [Flavobacteriales bacterium]